MPLDFELQLSERQPDRVIVSVRLAPSQGDSVGVDGVALSLQSATGEALSSRVLLPIAGTFQQPMRSAIEIRAHTTLPLGARVVGLAWSSCHRWEANIPADPGTQLQAHVRGHTTLVIEPDEDFVDHLRPLNCSERDVLGALLPWLAPCPAPEPSVVDDPKKEDDLRAAAADLGLDGDEADWLADLLTEE